MTLVRLLAALVFVISVPLAISLTNLRVIALSPHTYQLGFERYGAAASTGMSPAELETAATQLISYFDRGKPITLEISKNGQVAPLFNDREVAHLADVQALFQLAFRVQAAAVAYILLHLVAALVLRGWGGARYAAGLLMWGGVLTVGLLLAMSAAALVDFDSLFLRFHLVSFSNDLWILDPRTDYMIRLFPQGFWLEATVSLAVRSMAVGLGIALVGGVGLLATRRRAASAGRMRRGWFR